MGLIMSCTAKQKKRQRFFAIIFMEYYENIGIEKFIILEFDDFEWNDDHSVDATTPALIDFDEIVF